MKFEVTTPEAEQMLNALAQQPYMHVAALIAKLQTQAQAQLQPPAEPQPAAPQPATTQE